MFFQLLLLRLMRTNFDRPLVFVLTRLYCIFMESCLYEHRLYNSGPYNVY